MKPVRFSELYSVTRVNRDDWFDPLLTEDTRLSIDPFLIFHDDTIEWTNGHTRLMEFFQIVLELIAGAHGKKEVPAYVKAKALLTFPEPPEFCLGTSLASVLGAGSGPGLQRGMLAGAETVIALGVESLQHFEELALFGEQLGPDRIGDMTCNVLKPEFIKYTQRVAKRHGIPLTEVSVGRNGWSKKYQSWLTATAELPLNPYASTMKGQPVGVLLTPKRFLRQHPSVDSQEFWNFAYENGSAELRATLNHEIGKTVNRARIAAIARQNPRLLKEYVSKLEGEAKAPYDVDVDPKLIVKSSDFAKFVASTLDTTVPNTEEEFLAFVEAVVVNFKHCVESGPGPRLLWVDDKPRSEAHVQDLFQYAVVMSCKDHDVDLSPEANAGRGPVDFKMSRGWRKKVLIELKLAKSSSFRRNLINQPALYAEAEGCEVAYFIVVQFTDKDCDPDFMDKALETAAAVEADKGIRLRVVFVDARKDKPSASIAS